MGFQEEYDKLNARQRQAVDRTEGPVLVIAGPGTGKTQLLSVRVANILRRTDSGPENILCLTFTNKAAHNMQQRLLQLVGPTAQKVMVKTFHGFAAEIMNIYPDYFWSGAHLASVPETVQLEIVQEVLDTLPISSPLAKKFAGEYTAMADVLSGLRLAKEAGLTPAKLTSVIEANQAYINLLEPLLMEALSAPLSRKQLSTLQRAVSNLPSQSINEFVAPLISLDDVLRESFEQALKMDDDTGKLTNVSRWKLRWLQSVDGQKGMFAERKRNDWWLTLAKVYAGYRERLHKRGYYDYADMLVEVISQIEQHPDMRSEVQEQFLYVLIDEFQDTNAAQLRLAHLVADYYTSSGQPNLMVVGDDDQSIFKFNGAELNNVLNFRQFYNIQRPIVLTENYRSTQAVLNAAQRVAQTATNRLANYQPDLDKQLIAAKPPKIKGLLEHRCYDSQEEQYTDVVQAIKKTRKPGTSIAVLARSHTSLRQLASLLHQAGLDIAYEQRNNILDHTVVQQVYLLARLTVSLGRGDKQTVDASLAELLQYPMWHVKPSLLWRLAVANRNRPAWLESLQNGDKHMQKIAAWLLALARESKTVTVPRMLEHLLGLRTIEGFQSPLRDYYLREKRLTSEYLTGLSAIRLLRQLVEEFVFQPPATLADLVRFIDISRANKRVIADISTFVGGQQAIELLTVHKAKGLEFDTVFIIDAVDNNWRPRSGGRKPPANLPLQPYGDDLDDYVRLMYVAMTRARHTIVATSFRFDTQGNDMLPTPILDQALPKRPMKVFTPLQQTTTLEQTIGWPEVASGNRRTLLKPILDNYRLSASGLLDFLDVKHAGPDYFRQRRLLKLPEVKTVSQSYGTAMHRALEVAQLLTNQGAFSLAKTQAAFRQALTAEHLGKDEYKRYRIHGEAILQQLLKQLRYKLPKGSLPEQELPDVQIGQTRLSGTLDRLDVLDKDHLVINDYKTGQPLHGFTTRDQTKAIKAWRHRTQLMFYALLVKHSGRFSNYENVTAQMVYVEAESKTTLIRSLNPTPAEIDRTRQLTLAVWQHIQSASFPNISKYSTDIKGIEQFESDLLEGLI